MNLQNDYGRLRIGSIGLPSVRPRNHSIMRTGQRIWQLVACLSGTSIPIFRVTVLTRKSNSGISEFMMLDQITLRHERVDDIPLLIGLMQGLHFPELLEEHLG